MERSRSTCYTYSIGRLAVTPRKFTQQANVLFQARAIAEWRIRASMIGALLFLLLGHPLKAQVAGTVFRDYNANGTRDTYEGGVASVTVTAYFNGTSAAVVSTTAGSYSFAAATIPSTTAVRLEFSSPSTGDFSAPFSAATAGNGTSVQFVTAGAAATNINFAVNLPIDYCQANPPISIPCYENGLRTSNANTGIVAFNYTASGTTSTGTNAKTTDATIQQAGSVWGTDYQAVQKRLFAGSFLKRHVDLGPQGLGGFLVLDYNASATTPTSSTFTLQGVTPSTGPIIDLGSVNRSTAVGAIPATSFQLSTTSTTPNIDLDAHEKVGKMGYGGVALDNTKNRLWSVNLNQRSLISMDVSSATLPGTVNHYPLETLPGYPTPAAYTNSGTTTTRIEVGGVALVDANGNAFLPDVTAPGVLTVTGGSAVVSTNTITNLGNAYERTNSSQLLYQTIRTGASFSYAIPVVNGRYRVLLDVSDPLSTTSGQRTTTATVESYTALSNFDTWASRVAVANRATTTQFVVDVTDGILNLAFTGGGTTGNAIVAGIEVTPVASGSSGTVRPWGLSFNSRDGKGYLGVVSDASTSLRRADLQAYVLQFDPANVAAGFTTVVSFPLNYTRENTNGGGLPGQWTAWRNDITLQGDVSDPSYRRFSPTPLLSGIEFTENGSMVLGFIDQVSLWAGFYNYSAYTGTTLITEDFRVAGDIIQVCYANGIYVVEQGNSGTICKCNDPGGTDLLTNDGPSNAGEFYYDDKFTYPDGTTGHQEIATGGLLQRKGSGEVLTTVYDPIGSNALTGQGIFSQGVHWYNDQTGAKNDAFLIVPYEISSRNFGKEQGLGDPALRCDVAPIEIGNRVFRDNNRNGIQDPTEPGISGVAVTLYNGNTLLATATTNTDGEYYFSSGAGTNTAAAIYSLTALTPGTTVQLRLNQSQSAISSLSLTAADQGTNDAIDSDFAPSAAGSTTAVANIKLGASGQNVHTFDAGLYACPTITFTAPTAATVTQCANTTLTMSASTTAIAPDAIRFVYFNAPLTTATDAYTATGGTVLGTVTSGTATGTNTVTLPNVLLPDNVGDTVRAIYVYAILVTSDNVACRPVDQFVLQLNPRPIVSIGGDAIFCQGATTQLTALGVSGATYQWYVNGGSTVVSTANPFTTPAISTTTTYQVRATLAGCPSDLASYTLTPVVCNSCAGGPTTVGGQVYQDFNSDGVKQTDDLGVVGVTVTIFRCDATNQSTQIAQMLTDINGAYSFTGLTAGVDYRVEFANLPAGTQPTYRGTQNGTTVQFTRPGSCSVSLGINYPSDFCQATPRVMVPCYENGTGTGSTDPGFVSFNYGTTTKRSDGTIGQIGSVWGVAYQRTARKAFTSAFLKRHVGFAAQGPGGVYVYDYANPAVNAPLVASFSLQGVTPANGGATIDLGTVTRVTSPATDPNYISTVKTSPNYDIDAFVKVGKISFGDADVDETNNRLWLVNLNQRAIISLNISGTATSLNGASAATLSPLTNQYLLDNLPGVPSCGPDGVFRPWALAFHRGKGYLGGVCSSEITQDKSKLQAYVLEFDPANVGAGFTTVMTVPMTYPREQLQNCCDNLEYQVGGSWKSWISKYADIVGAPPGHTRVGWPQPILSDIAFADNGSMIMGFTDRLSHQWGQDNYAPIVGNTTLTDINGGGDILHACFINGRWVLEGTAGSCKTNDVLTSSGYLLANDGPSRTGEFYPNDRYVSSAAHYETANGGLVTFPGQNEVITTAYDITNIFQQGVKYFSTTTGANNSGSFAIIPASDNTAQFGKGNGLGDLEITCDAAPIQIGNRVWRDDNLNGIQDPCEPAIPGAVVTLYDATKTTAYASVTTNAAGEYYFASTTLTAGTSTSSVATTALTYNTPYALVITSLGTSTVVNGITLTSVSPLTPGESGTANSGTTQINNDARIVNGRPCIELTTGGPGSTNHTYDFGLVTCVPPAVTALAVSNTLCVGQSATIYAQVSPSGSYTYTVTSPAGVTLTGANSATAVATGLSVGVNTFTVAVGSSPACQTTTTVSVSVAVPPTITLLSATICVGQPVSLTATGAGAGATYVFSTSGAAGNVLTVSPTVTTPYTVTGTTSGGCSATATAQVTVNTKPNAGTDQVLVCGPLGVTPTATALTATPLGGTWSNQLGNPTTAIFTPNAAVTTVGSLTTGTYNFIYTAPNGCTDTVAVTVPVCQTFCASLSATASASSSTVTAGGSVTLTASVTPVGSYTYAWSGPAGTTVTPANADAVTASGLPAGVNTFTVTITSSPGCFTTATVSVTALTPTLALSVTPGVCQTATNQYDISGTISLSAAIASTLTISDGTSTTTVSVTAGQTTTSFSLTGITSDGLVHTVIASGTGYSPASATYTAPASCSVAPALALLVTPGTCSTATNSYNVTGTISLTAAVASTLVITDGTSTTTVAVTAGQTTASFSLSGLTSNGLSHTVTVSGTGYSPASATYTAPASCSVAPALALTVTPSSCSTATNSYNITGTISLTAAVASTLTITDGTSTTTVSVTAGQTTASFGLSGLNSNGLVHTLIVSGTGYSPASATYTAPASCSIAPALALGVTAGTCSTATNAYNITGTISLTAAVASTLTITDGTSTTTVAVAAGQTTASFSLTGLASNGILHTVTVSGAGYSPASATYTAPASCTVLDLALRKTISAGQSATVTAGSSVTFTITVFNQGTVPATVINLVDYIPAGLTLTDPNWTLGAGVATLNTPIASLSAGASTTRTISFSVSPAVTGQLINRAEISSNGGGTDIDSSPDTNPLNDAGGSPDSPADNAINGNGTGTAGGSDPLTDEDDADPASITVIPAPVFDLALRKTLAPGQTASVTPGSSVTFTVSVFNQGNVTATAIQVSDYIPAGLTLNDVNWTAAGGIATMNTTIASLSAGATTTRTIIFTVNAGVTGDVVNRAEISSATGGTDIDSRPDTNPANDAGGAPNTGSDDAIDGDGTGTPNDSNANTDEDDADPALITVTPTPVCSINPVVTPGVCNTVTNTYSVTALVTLGNTTRGVLTVTNGVQSMTTTVAAGLTSFTFSAVFTGLISDGSSHTVTASLPGCDTATAAYSAPESCTVGVALTATPGVCQSATNGYVVTGTVSLTNAPAGRATITDGLVSTTLAVGLGTTMLPYSLSVLSSGTNTHTVTVSFAGQTASVTYTAPASCSVTPALGLSVTAGTCSTATNSYNVTGTISLTAAVASTLTITDGTSTTTVAVAAGQTSASFSLTGLPSTGLLHTVTVNGTGYAPVSATYTAPASCSIAPIFDLALRKTLAVGQAASVTPGSSVTFTVTIFNQGAVTATAIQVSDYIPAGLTLNDPNWTAAGGIATMNTPIASLSAGASVTRNIVFTVGAGALGDLVNRAEISAATGGTDIDSRPDNNPANDAGGAANTPSDDVVTGNGTGTPGSTDPLTDEDDADPAVITVTAAPVCSINPVVTVGVCASASNTYSITATVTAANTVAGTLSLSTQGRTLTTAVAGGLASFTYATPITGLISDGLSHTLVVSLPGCDTAVINYTAPASCSVAPASLGDFVFADNNSNGVQDTGEPGIPGVTVTLLSSNTVVTTTTTNASGLYSFRGLTPGVPYSVSFTTPANYSATTPLSGTNTAVDSNPIGGVTAPVTLTSGENNTTLDAGFVPKAVEFRLAVVDPGVCQPATNQYVTSGVISLTGALAGIATVTDGSVSTTVVIAAGQTTANYSLTGLVSGTSVHTVVVTLAGQTASTTYTAPLSCISVRLSVQKSVSLSKADLGNLLTYTLVITNAGSTSATTTVRDSLGAGASYVVGSARVPASTSFTAGRPVSLWNVPIIAAGQSLSMTYQVRVDSTGIIYNVASIPGDTAKVCTTVSVTMCPGDTYQLTAPAGRASYSWYRNGVLILGQSTNVLTITQPGSYSLGIGNAGLPCSDFSCCPFILELDSLPVFQTRTVPGTCLGNTPQANGQLLVSNVRAGLRYQYSTGAVFNPAASLSGPPQVIPASGVLVTNLANPATAQFYTVRVYNSSGCYTDQTVILPPTICGCPADVCVPFVIQQTKRPRRIGDPIR